MKIEKNEAYKAVCGYYETHNEHERFSHRYNSVEFITTKLYIERYLKPGARIIEIGAGSGRYSHHFARMGYSVDAVELSERNIELFSAGTSEGEDVRIHHGSAVDLGGFEDDSFDVTLLLGPMYHLFTREDQKKALSESIRVTKKGGIIAVSYCMNEATVMGFGFFKENIKDRLESGMIDRVTYKCHSTPEDIFVLWRTEEINELIRGFPLERLHFVGTDMYTNYFREQITAMDEESFGIYLDYHLSICERADMVGMSHHTLDILRKA